MERHLAEAMPLESLLGYRVPAPDDDELEEWLGDAEGGAASAASIPHRRTALFVAHATNLAEYRRVSRGDDVLPALFTPLLAGRDIGEVLAGPRVHTTVRALEADWRLWVRQMANAKHPAAMVSVRGA